VDAELKTASLLACLPPFSPTVSTSNFFPFQNRKKKKNVKSKKTKKQSKTFENQERIKNLENEQKRQTSKKKTAGRPQWQVPTVFARKENKKLLLV
jgi:hypothetical protein